MARSLMKEVWVKHAEGHGDEGHEGDDVELDDRDDDLDRKDHKGDEDADGRDHRHVNDDVDVGEELDRPRRDAS